MIIFRFYDLEQRAIAFAEEGVDLPTTAALITQVVERKVEFYQANSYSARQATIQGMRNDWNAYILQVHEQLGR